MESEVRQKRLRRLVKKLNEERKKQAQKIDILCKDFIAGHKDFIKGLDTVSFAASFYESIVGATELTNLLYIAGKTIRDEIGDVNVAFFLRKNKSFELHLFESDRPVTLEKYDLENCFTHDLVDNICKSNKQCTLDDLLKMGLQGNPSVLRNISLVAVPLGQFGSSFGFILIYRPAQEKFNGERIKNVVAITSGLSRAIDSCQMLMQAVD